MILSTHFNSGKPKFPVKVIGNGFPTSNIPLGATGTVIGTKPGNFQLRWDHNDLVEWFSMYGGAAMGLDIVEEK